MLQANSSIINVVTKLNPYYSIVSIYLNSNDTVNSLKTHY